MVPSSGSSFFKVDAHLPKIACPVWGTVLLAFPIGVVSDAFRERYEKMTKASSTVLQGTGLYMYPVDFIHITVASPVLFADPPKIPPSQQEHFERIWGEKLALAAASKEWEMSPFDVHYKDMRLDLSAGVRDCFAADVFA